MASKRPGSVPQIVQEGRHGRLDEDVGANVGDATGWALVGYAPSPISRAR
jgi:hypothetical protein